MQWDRVTDFVRYNSGRHICDSGGEHGRIWQQPAPPADQPIVYCDPAWPTDGATISTAAWLRDNIEEHAELTEAWQASEAYADGDLPWFDACAQFLTDAGYRQEATDNVYNCENDFDQVFVWQVWVPADQPCLDWVYADDAVVVFYIHTGADVRGGYSPPILAASDRTWGEYVFPLDWQADYYQVDTTPVVAGQAKFAVGEADRWQPTHGDNGDGFWTQGYSGYPWGAVCKELGEPIAAAMVDGVPQWTFADGTVVAAEYPYQG